MPMDFLGFPLAMFLSTLSPYFPCELQTYKASISYLLLHFLMKLVFVSFSFFLTLHNFVVTSIYDMWDGVFCFLI